MFESTLVAFYEVNNSSGSRPEHKVARNGSKFPNLNENRQKSHFWRGFLTQNPVNILSRSATEQVMIYDKFPIISKLEERTLTSAFLFTHFD